MAFYETPRFPTGIGFGAVGGPGFSTDVITINSGFEQRQQNWSVARCSYDVARAVKNDTDRLELINFFVVMKGKTHGFRFKDFTDYQVLVTEGVFTALGNQTYQMVKNYTNAAGTYARTIKKPVASTVVLTGLTLTTHYTLDSTTGIVTFVGSPAAGPPTTWSGQFDVPCRFDTDQLKLVAEDISLFRSQSIPIVEIRV